jgi:hypothetical protein
VTVAEAQATRVVDEVVVVVVLVLVVVVTKEV